MAPERASPLPPPADVILSTWLWFRVVVLLVHWRSIEIWKEIRATVLPTHRPLLPFSLNVLYKAEQNFQNVSFRCYRSSLSDQGQQECTNLVSSFSDGLIKLLIDFHSFSVALFLLPLSHLRLFSNAYMISQFCASVRDKEWFSLFLPEAPVKKTVAHGSRR